MIKNIIFDMGGVLIRYKPREILEEEGIDKETADLALKEIFKSKLWNEKDRGTVFPEDIWKEKGHLFSGENAKKIKDMTFNLYPYMKPFPKMEKLIVSLKNNGYGIYLLSNAALDFYENKWRIPALKLFDGYLISADYLLLKPEKEIYEKLWEKFNLIPEECVFIDDMPQNVKGSIDAGMQAICYDHGNIEILKTDLEKLGVKL